MFPRGTRRGGTRGELPQGTFSFRFAEIHLVVPARESQLVAQRRISRRKCLAQLFLIRGVDDLHEVSGLQGSAADQAAVVPSGLSQMGSRTDLNPWAK